MVWYSQISIIFILVLTQFLEITVDGYLNVVNYEAIKSDGEGPVEVLLKGDSLDTGRKYNACIFLNTTACYCEDAHRQGVERVGLPEKCRSRRPPPHWISVRLYSEEDDSSTSNAGRYESTVPFLVPVAAAPKAGSVTLVLLVTSSDMNRAALLFASLGHHAHAGALGATVHEMLVVTPDAHVRHVADVIVRDHFDTLSPSFPVRVLPESHLLRGPNGVRVRYTYGLQMGLKLMVANKVVTDFYVTLDADVVLLRPLVSSTLIIDGRAIYEPEPRHVHPKWWQDSAVLLDTLDSFDEAGPGFSVTPAVLSTYGGALVVDTLERLYGTDFEQHWLGDFGSAEGTGWSEYTLYRLVLDASGLFDALHVPQNTSGRLHCGDVWFHHQLPWRPADALEQGCVFSVVQSSAGGEVEVLFRDLFDAWKQQLGLEIVSKRGNEL